MIGLAFLTTRASSKFYDDQMLSLAHTKTTCFDYVPSGMFLSRLTVDTDIIDTGILPCISWLLYYTVNYAGLIAYVIIILPVGILGIFPILLVSGIIIVSGKSIVVYYGTLLIP